jgi:aminopeptidase N
MSPSAAGSRSGHVRRKVAGLLAVTLGIGLVTGPLGGASATTGPTRRSEADQPQRSSAAQHSAAAPVPGKQASGDTLFPTVGNGGYDVLHYDISLRYATAGTISATTKVKAKATKKLSSYSLDLEGLTVTSVRVGGHAAAFSRRGDKLVVTPRRAVRGTFTTTVAYRGRPVTHIDPDGAKDGWVPTGDGATVVSEPVGAMTWFPNNNTPRDKATFAMRIRVPRALAVAGNGDLVKRDRHGATTTWSWRQTKPMATYLAMISIGRYTVYHSTMTTVGGRKLPIWSFIDPALGALAAQRKLIPTIIRFQERQFGRYPFTSVGIVVKKINVGYALETQNRPVFDEVPNTLTLVHELAHQWYGDSVTPRDWGDIWLNEGFASYAESLWTAAHGGPSTRAAFLATMKANPASSDLWQPAPASLTDPADLFGDPSYVRGGLTLEALRTRVGSADFFTILRRWADQQRGRSVGTADFIALSERVTDQNLSRLFNDWLYVAERPEGY